MTQQSDAVYMSRAIQLAKNGQNTTHPNPRVGCVVVKGDSIVGEGWHQVAGEAHAEVNALNDAGSEADQATLYVTLEPCSHFGKTPPCVNAVINAGIQRVVIGVIDSNPEVKTKGVDALITAGISVTTGVCEASARALNKGYHRRMEGGYPWVKLKIASSLDGKTAMDTGESQWITSEPARNDAHRLRASSSAVLTGVGTVLRDDPSMTARIDNISRQPLRVVLDTHLSTPASSKILQSDADTLIFTAVDNDPEDLSLSSSDHVEVCTLVTDHGKINLEEVMEELAKREVNEVLLEAGAQLSGAMLSRGLVDEVILYQSPDILGENTKGLFNLSNVTALHERMCLEYVDTRKVGRDLRLTMQVLNSPQSLNS